MSIFRRSADTPIAGTRRPQNTRVLFWAGIALLIVLLALGSWIGVNALSIKSNLQNARTSAQNVKESLLKGNTDEASQWAEQAVEQAQSARSAAYSTPWNIAAAMPLLGGPFKTAQQISDVAVGLVTDILRPAAKAGVGLSPAKLYSDGRVDVQLLRNQSGALRELAQSAERLKAQADEIQEANLLSAVQNARSQIQSQTSSLASLLHNSALAADVAPAMMGADGPRSYLMAFQTNAEARGTGGLLGGFGVVRFDNGKPTVDTLGPNDELAHFSANVDLGPEFNQQYGFTNPFTDFRNSNISSHFPYAAQIWKSMWESKSGAPVDGVIAIDPVALSYILGAEGPVTMADGQVVTAENVVELTESTIYARFPEDQIARKKYLQDIANEVVKKMTGPVKSPRDLLDALGKAITERRIAIWSASPADEKILEQTPLAHVIPDDAAPYAEVVINNLGGNKMDYYLKRQITYVADECKGDTRNATITVRLTNTATDQNLPDYVAGLGGLSPQIRLKVPRATMVTSVRVLATSDARLLSAESNGQRVAVVTHTERGHPSYEIQVVIPPGQSGELTFRLSEPTSPGEARVPVQPLIDNVVPKVSVPACQ